MGISKEKLKEKLVLISLSVPQGLNVLNAHLGCLKGRSRRLVGTQFLHCSPELSAFSQAFIFSSQQAEFSMFLLPCAPQLPKTRDPIISALQAQLSGVRRVQAFFAFRKGRQQAKVLNRNLSFFSLLHRKLEKSSK